ncbi:MAG: VWA domain-containing protein [Myxococcota bacterium]
MKPLLFGDFFYGLRQAGLKVGIPEWMGLLEAMQKGAIRSLDDLYFVGRAMLVKSEAHFDTYDQVFAAIFADGEFPTADLEKVLDWLKDAKKRPQLSPEQLAALEKLDLETLRKRFEERLDEQKKRHDGGSRWVGTGGTSPFGHGGQNPAGVRVGGSGGGRSAIQIAQARQFEAYRWDRILETRDLAIALKKLRKLTRRHDQLELDIDKSIDETCKNAGELMLEFTPPRKNEARVLLLMDVGGSMDPYSHLVERLFSAAHGLQHWRRFEAYSFHNCVYEELDPARPHEEAVLTADLIADRPKETFLIFVGDAYMAPSELIDPHGSIYYYHHHKTPGLAWLHRLRSQFPRCIWLNPIPERAWHGWTIRMIREIVPMYPLTLKGLTEGVDYLVKGTPPLNQSLRDLFPDLPQLWSESEA